MWYIIVYYIILHTYIHVLGNDPFPVTVTRIFPFLGSGIPHSSSPATITAGICIEKYARRPSKWLHSSEPQIFGILKIPNKFHWNLPPPSLVWVANISIYNDWLGAPPSLNRWTRRRLKGDFLIRIEVHQACLFFAPTSEWFAEFSAGKNGTRFFGGGQNKGVIYMRLGKLQFFNCSTKQFFLLWTCVFFGLTGGLNVKSFEGGKPKKELTAKLKLWENHIYCRMREII